MLSIGATVLASQTGCHVCHLQVTDLPTTWLVEALNPLSPKIWLIILPSRYNTSCCTSTWWVWVFLLPVCRLLYGYYRENLQCTCLSLLGAIGLSLLTNKWLIKPSWTSRSVVWLLDAVHTIITGSWSTCIGRIVNILEILLCRWKWKWRGQQWGGEKEKETQEI